MKPWRAGFIEALYYISNFEPFIYTFNVFYLDPHDQLLNFMLEDLRKDRLAKLKKIQQAGINPYPARTRRTHTVAFALENFNILSKTRKKIRIAGRLTGLRDQGGVLFLDIEDESGKLQAVLKKENLRNFQFLKSVLDRGDFISLGGTLFQTKRGEKSIEVKDAQFLAKSLLPIPAGWFGIEDIETRFRKRYLDFILNKETRLLFKKKAVFWDTFRSELKRAGFLEIETPVLEVTPGGAETEPFVTHMNALDTDFYLRISLELSLKKLLVGGFEKVFEIGRIFRNEGISREHLQDYTQLEFYWAYSDYTELMKFVEKLYKTVIKKTTGGITTIYQNKKINWGKKWEKIEYVEAFKDKTGMDPLTATRDDLMKKAKALGLSPESYAGKGRLIDLIYKKTVRPELIQPAFLVNPPAEIEPLAKRKEEDPRLVERFQIMACGTEVGKGFSELNDPLDQRARFEEQMKLRQAGDREAQMMDEEFVEALEYGMPPASGFGVSERLFAVLMDRPIRETVVFPLMRRK